ncbi:hypothetical protein LH464_15650 [Neorhizobium sp. T786]|uniref:DUF6894 family protein n=1 Tax=Pseudorhizobium xiangyangii TaxID=2883104 RepID=UPI001D0002B6|nr:hypothetical protein [Neorhizobium xiangyangii]MCB5203906.1 hypothetical protein [Neorhizobium xiangyangii]
MPKYYFHIRKNDKLNEDEDGLEFGTLDQAYEQALRAILEMRSPDFPNVEDDRVFEITTPDGLVLKEIAFSEVIDVE